jgi:hypothetical protein
MAKLRHSAHFARVRLQHALQLKAIGRYVYFGAFAGGLTELFEPVPACRFR